MDSLYYYNKFSSSAIQNSTFAPSSNNWLLNASNGKESIYFPNLSSFRHWSSTCCGQSADAIYTGQLNSYKVTYNNYL